MADVKKVATRVSYGEALVELGNERDDFVVLDADLAAATQTGKFKAAHPERFYDAGIAESNLMGLAAGIATTGHVAFASTFAMFAAGRAYEQVRNSIGYPHLNVKIGATHAGISVGEDGATHQCCEDIALMRTIPGMTVIVPADDIEARACVRAAYEFEGPVYMRFGKAPVLEVTPQDVDEIRQLFQLIKTMLRSDKERYRHEIIRTLFTTAFYIITEINQREQPGEIKQGRCEVLFDEFMSLLQQYNKRERNVSFYAKQLNITPKYLSSVVKEVSGKTAARWIDESVILEAKALLKYSGMSIQEIAYHLNFSTQSFFGKYFKQHTGTSPSRYKRKG